MKEQKVLRRFILFLAIATLVMQYSSLSQTELPIPIDTDSLSSLDGKYSFIIASDLGRNGYYQQKPTAEMMGEIADLADIEFIAALGDVHHYLGVQSTDDPLWLTNYELI